MHEMSRDLLIVVAILLLVTYSCSTAKNKVVTGNKSDNTGISEIDFTKYRKLDAVHYRGVGYLAGVTARKNYNITRFIFEPGGRNNWHLHPGAEQVLYVLEGEGYYQQEEKPKQFIKKGDVIVVPPDTKHWNGATNKSHLIHLSISDNAGGEHVKWFEPGISGRLQPITFVKLKYKNDVYISDRFTDCCCLSDYRSSLL